MFKITALKEGFVVEGPITEGLFVTNMDQAIKFIKEEFTEYSIKDMTTEQKRLYRASNKLPDDGKWIDSRWVPNTIKWKPKFKVGQRVIATVNGDPGIFIIEELGKIDGYYWLAHEEGSPSRSISAQEDDIEAIAKNKRKKAKNPLASRNQ